MTWLSEMEYPHWMMLVGAVLVVAGFVGLWISRNRNLEPAENNLLPAASPNFSVAGRAEGEAMSIVTDLLDDRGKIIVYGSSQSWQTN